MKITNILDLILEDKRKVNCYDKKMIRLLNQLADLADEASETIFDDGKKNGTGGILKLCDKLTMKIDKYLGN